MRNTRGIFNLVLAVLAQPLCAHADEAVTLSDAYTLHCACCHAKQIMNSTRALD